MHFAVNIFVLLNIIFACNRLLWQSEVKHERFFHPAVFEGPCDSGWLMLCCPTDTFTVITDFLWYLLPYFIDSSAKMFKSFLNLNHSDCYNKTFPSCFPVLFLQLEFVRKLISQLVTHWHITLVGHVGRVGNKTQTWTYLEIGPLKFKSKTEFGEINDTFYEW